MRKNWMKDVDGNRSLADMLIPGTHDSGTCRVSEDSGTVGRFIEDLIGAEAKKLSKSIEKKVEEEVRNTLGRRAASLVPHDALRTLIELVSESINLLLRAPVRREIANAMARCQHAHMGIEDQLENGIRFLDIRCHASSSQSHMQLFHGAFQCDLTLESVIDTCVRFLQRNPQEAVIMMIKQEQSKLKSSDFARNVLRHMNRHSDHIYLDPEIPKLKHARGKIVLVNRFMKPTDEPSAPKKLGFVVEEWEDNKIFSKTNCHDKTFAVQDKYEF